MSSSQPSFPFCFPWICLQLQLLRKVPGCTYVLQLLDMNSTPYSTPLWDSLFTSLPFFWYYGWNSRLSNGGPKQVIWVLRGWLFPDHNEGLSFWRNWPNDRLQCRLSYHISQESTGPWDKTILSWCHLKWLSKIIKWKAEMDYRYRKHPVLVRTIPLFVTDRSDRTIEHD